METNLTKLQEALVRALKYLRIPVEIVLPVMLCLKTEAQQRELARWLRDNLERRPGAEEVVEKTSEILNSGL